jgi:hypothetical protein
MASSTRAFSIPPSTRTSRTICSHAEAQLECRLWAIAGRAAVPHASENKKVTNSFVAAALRADSVRLIATIVYGMDTGHNLQPFSLIVAASRRRV